jgi:hypothetical protein
MTGPTVRWRERGHRLDPASDVLRFEVADLNPVIARAAADSELYQQVQSHAGIPADHQVLVLSCFAVTDAWPPSRLAEGTRFRAARVAAAARILDGGYALWPTETFVDGVPDPRNEVHYDLVVASGPDLFDPGDLAGTTATRAAARNRLRPLFEQVLVLLGEPRTIPAAGGTMGPRS